MAVLLRATTPVLAQTGAKNGDDWRNYGPDAGGTRYSPLDQINKSNVGTLQIVRVQARTSLVVGTSGLKGVLTLPTVRGGSNWQGGAVDPETGILYVASQTTAWAFAVTQDPKRSSMDMLARAAAVPRSWVPRVSRWLNRPAGRIAAINLNAGDHVWMVPNGEAPDYVKNHRR